MFCPCRRQILQDSSPGQTQQHALGLKFISFFLLELDMLDMVLTVKWNIFTQEIHVRRWRFICETLE